MSLLTFGLLCNSATLARVSDGNAFLNCQALTCSVHIAFQTLIKVC